jgi:hypothetical protein
MFSREITAKLATLTTQQLCAVERLQKTQGEHFFSGVSVEIIICDFADVNALKETNPEKAVIREAQLFATCYRNSTDSLEAPFTYF